MKKPTKSQIKKALQESIEHWKTMIEWTSKQKIYGNVSEDEMYDEIKMMWYDDDCSLCRLCRPQKEDECVGCPLGRNIGCCKEWKEVDRSGSWGDWLDTAKNMLYRLEKELRELK